MHPTNRERTTLGWILAFAGLGFVIAAGVHGWKLLAPIAGDPSPPWRHALFVGINLTVVSGLILRWRGFVPAFGLLLVQQLYSHGWLRWQSGELGGQDVTIVLGMPVLLALLILDRPRGPADEPNSV